MFGKTEEEWIKLKAVHTCREIYQQPTTWLKTLDIINEKKYEIKRFIDQVTSQSDFDIVFTGAGTSEYVGNTLFHYLNKVHDYKVKSYGTTDIVLNPEKYLSSSKPTLLISFGRSGDSPESVGAVQIANKVCGKIYHLFITCNENGALALEAEQNDNCLSVVLSPETLDKSFAMTSSYTNMVLAACLCLDIDNLDLYYDLIEKLVVSTNKNLDEKWCELVKIVHNYDFNKIVYLGSNSLKGVSQESQLKMLELTQGKVVTMFDTPLGFRHGPKSIVDDKTLVVLYLSDNEYTKQYEIDLLKEMKLQQKGNKIMGVGNYYANEAVDYCDYLYKLDVNQKLDEIILGLSYVTVAQIIALFKSISCDIWPDDPCPTGEVNRVVKGVTIYNL